MRAFKGLLISPSFPNALSVGGPIHAPGSGPTYVGQFPLRPPWSSFHFSSCQLTTSNWTAGSCLTPACLHLHLFLPKLQVTLLTYCFCSVLLLSQSLQLESSESPFTLRFSSSPLPPLLNSFRLSLTPSPSCAPPDTPTSGTLSLLRTGS